MDERLEALAELILKGLVKKNLSTAAIFEFAEQSCSCIHEETELQWDHGLGKLWEYVSSGFVALECADKNESIAFQQGRIFAMLELLKLFHQKQTDERALEDDAKEYREHWRSVFATLKSGESMTHGALAAACNLSDSSLSQFLHRIENKNYIQSRKVGRTKYYRLSSRGQKLLERMPPKKEASMRVWSYTHTLKELDFEQETDFQNSIGINLYYIFPKNENFEEYYSFSGMYTSTKDVV